MTTTDKDYGFRTKVDATYAEAVDRVTAALKQEGFGVLTEIDVQATLKKKLDADFRRYVILGACNPVLAQQALQCELEIGLLLPCNVIVYEDDAGHSVVSIINPMMMVDVVANPEMQAVADEANARLRRVISALEAGTTTP